MYSSLLHVGIQTEGYKHKEKVGDGKKEVLAKRKTISILHNE